MKGTFQIEIPEMELPNGVVSKQTAGFPLLPLCSYTLVSNPGKIVCAPGHFSPLIYCSHIKAHKLQHK